MRVAAINTLKMDNKDVAKAATPVLRKLATTEKEPHVLAEVLIALGQLKDKKDSKLLTNAFSSQSYGVQGASLQALGEVDAPAALARAKTLEADPHLAQAVTNVYARQGGPEQWAYIRTTYDAASSRSRYGFIQPMVYMLNRLDDPTAFAEATDRLKQLAMQPQLKAYGFDKRMIDALQKASAAQASRPNAAKNQATAAAAIQAIQAAK
jgi:aminopeptidase N